MHMTVDTTTITRKFHARDWAATNPEAVIATITEHLEAAKAVWPAELVGWIITNKAIRASRARLPVVQLQPDEGSPGLWIGFATGKDRDEAMKLFRLE